MKGPRSKGPRSNSSGHEVEAGIFPIVFVISRWIKAAHDLKIRSTKTSCLSWSRSCDTLGVASTLGTDRAATVFSIDREVQKKRSSSTNASEEGFPLLVNPSQAVCFMPLLPRSSKGRRMHVPVGSERRPQLVFLQKCVYALALPKPSGM